MSKFLGKMYDPHILKNKYLINLNDGIGIIKRNTRKNIFENNMLAKKQVQIEKMSNELLLYNNPSIYQF